jgi:2-succinyl-5-enolpyruvyl-6-hydroxy-3-cyclohexene-1-carboxylate synthase
VELGDISLACASSLVAGLADGGVRHAAVSPGSRSTALALALARDPRVQVHVQLDERSGGFFALGAAKSTGRPAIVACTSGTAAAELLPAVVEAAQARVPLVVLTADRPPRLRGTGANQTIVQPGLFGEYVHASFDLPVPSTAGQEAWWRQAAREALEAMATDPTGPVHLNCPFEEPLTPTTDTSLIGGDVVDDPFTWPVRPAAELDPDEADRLAQLVSGSRGAVVFGGWLGHLSSEGQFWAELLGWPVLAEPTSGARQPGTALAAGQAMIAGPWAVPDEPSRAAVRRFGRASGGGGSVAPRSRSRPPRLLAAGGGPRGAPQRPRKASCDPGNRHRPDRPAFEG